MNPEDLNPEDLNPEPVSTPLDELRAALADLHPSHATAAPDVVRVLLAAAAVIVEQHELMQKLMDSSSGAPAGK